MNSDADRRADWPPPKPAPPGLPNRLGGLHSTGIVLAWLLGPPIAFRVGVLNQLGVDAPGLAAPDPLTFVRSACYFWFWMSLRFAWIPIFVAFAWFVMAVRGPDRWRTWWRWRLQRDKADGFIAEFATLSRTIIPIAGTAIWITLVLTFALYQFDQHSGILYKVVTGVALAIAYPVNHLYHRLTPTSHIVREARVVLAPACVTICFLIFGANEAREFHDCSERRESAVSTVVGSSVGKFTSLSDGEQIVGMLLDTTEGVHIAWTGQRSLVIPVESVQFQVLSSAEVDCVNDEWVLKPGS